MSAQWNFFEGNGEYKKHKPPAECATRESAKSFKKTTLKLLKRIDYIRVVFKYWLTDLKCIWNEMATLTLLGLDLNCSLLNAILKFIYSKTFNTCCSVDNDILGFLLYMSPLTLALGIEIKIEISKSPCFNDSCIVKKHLRWIEWYKWAQTVDGQ